MGNLFLVAFSLIFSFAIFHQNIVFSGVNRAYLGLYKGVAERGVVLFDGSGQMLARPYFDYKITEAGVESYLQRALQSYVAEYETEYVFYNASGKPNYATPCSFSITLRCDISAFQTFERTACFTIKENV